jgi:hypothetical protein
MHSRCVLSLCCAYLMGIFDVPRTSSGAGCGSSAPSKRRAVLRGVTMGSCTLTKACTCAVLDSAHALEYGHSLVTCLQHMRDKTQHVRSPTLEGQ